MTQLTRIQWLECWDELRERIQTGNTSWGRNQILDLMTDIERRKVRESEVEDPAKQPIESRLVNLNRSDFPETFD